MNTGQSKIYNHFVEQIVNKELALHERIPSEAELSEKFGTTRMDAHRAIKKLEAFGVFRRNKKQGTFFHSEPSSLTIGELKSIDTCKVCVLNHSESAISEIHWNKRVVSAFDHKIEKSKIEISYRNIEHITSYTDFYDCLEKIATEGFNALVVIEDNFMDKIMSEYPELFFRFNKNVFIYNRGVVPFHEWPYSVVSVNLFGEGVLVAEYLISKAYEKIIYLSFHREEHWVTERERGLKYGFLRMTEGNIQIKSVDLRLRAKEPLETVVRDNPQLRDGSGATDYQQIENLGNRKEIEKSTFEGENLGVAKEKTAKILNEMTCGDERCAIVGANDEVAAFVFDVAKENNYSPGKDFGLIGFDNNIKFEKYNLTTVTPPLEEIGTTLAQLLIAKFKNKNNKTTNNIRIDSELIVGNTC